MAYHGRTVRGPDTALQARIDRLLAEVRAKRERGEKLTEREWSLVAHDAQPCACAVRR